MSRFRKRASGTAGRSVFWMADGGAGLPARSEMLRRRENAADVSELPEFDAALLEHVAPGKRSEEIRATIRADKSENAVC